MALKVAAHGSYSVGSDSLYICVLVEDEQGNAVTGLQEQNFKVWQLANYFKALSVAVVDLAADLPGQYFLVQTQWLPIPEGQYVFFVQVIRPVETTASTGDAGAAFAILVKTGHF